MRFANRRDAGRQLGVALARLDWVRPVVLALPRGGVPVGFEVARILSAPLDVFVARKIGAPGHPEFGVGAIAENSDVVVPGEGATLLGLDSATLDRLADVEREELERRVALYRGERPLPSVEGRDVLLVDDGLATGVTAEAALHALRLAQPSRLVLAVPVCASDTADRLRDVANDVVCLIARTDFRAVGMWYQNFRQITDEQVLEYLEAAQQ